MPKAGARLPHRLRHEWGHKGGRGTSTYYTGAEAAHAIDAMKARAVVLRTSITFRYTNLDTGATATATHDYTDRPPLRDEPGGTDEY